MSQDCIDHTAKFGEILTHVREITFAESLQRSALIKLHQARKASGLPTQRLAQDNTRQVPERFRLSEGLVRQGAAFFSLDEFLHGLSRKPPCFVVHYKQQVL